jgi:RES domain
MARIQAPPRNFQLLSLIVEDVEPAALVHMAWRSPASHCRFGRKARYRFDSPDHSFGVMYAAFDLATAFAETVLRDQPLRSADVILDHREVESRMVVDLKRGPDARPLRMVKLYDEGLAAAHTDNQISARDHYPTTQRWAEMFHAHSVAADGIVYMSRYMGARKSVALFDRCSAAVAVGGATPLVEHREFASIVELFDLAIDHR